MGHDADADADATPRCGAAPRSSAVIVLLAEALPCLFVAAAAASFAPAAGAESLRCNGFSADVGDSRLAVLYKCGEPLMRDAYCAPVFYSGTLQPVPDPYASFAAPCLVVDEWVYDRGPGNLVATVRFRSGVVQSIRYGRTPQ